MDVFKSFPLSLRMIFRDPINLMLTLIPTAIALSLYVFTIVSIFNRSDYLGLMIRDWLPEPSHAGWVGKLLTTLLILFVFLLMSWTFVIIVGIIAAPFNSMLSSRIESKLSQRVVSSDKGQTLNDVFRNLKQTFKNELKKLIFIVLLAVVAFLLNLFPLFYPVGMFLVATLLSIQFIDYSWSRHNMTFSACLGDVLKNIIPYSFSGFLFLLLVTVPIINALVPALATSYFTVLWLHRQKKITEVTVDPQLLRK